MFSLNNLFTKFILSFVLVFLTVGCGGSNTEENVKSKNKKILMIGDSLTDVNHFGNPNGYWVLV